MLKGIIAGVAAFILSYSVVSSAGTESGQIRYRLKEIKDSTWNSPGCLAGYGKSTYVQKVNDFGYAVGSFTCYRNANTPTVSGNAIAGFAHTGMRALAKLYPNESSSWALDVNNWGTVVGYTTTTDSPYWGSSEVWSANGTVRQSPLEAAECKKLGPFYVSFVESINDRGSMAGITPVMDPSGQYCTAMYGFVTRTGERYLYQINAGITWPLYINNSDVAVGSFDTDIIQISKTGVKKVFTGSDVSTLYSDSDSLSGVANKITNRNEILGSLIVNRFKRANNSGTHQDPVLMDIDGTIHMLPMVDGHEFGVPLDMNLRGEIVGAVGDQDPIYGLDRNRTVHATIWNNGQVHDLNDLTLRNSVTLVLALQISNRGEIYALGVDSNEPLQKCPRSYWDPETRQTIDEPDHMCANEHGYLLTPIR